MTIVRNKSSTEGVEEYCSSLPEFEAAPLWKDLGNLLTPEPVVKAVPHIWRYEEIRPKLMRAGEVVTAEEAERRVLMLMNPGLADRQASTRAAATELLYAGLQLVLPGEIAGPHRHTPAALRFIVEGSGAYSTVDGERAIGQ